MLDVIETKSVISGAGIEVILMRRAIDIISIVVCLFGTEVKTVEEATVIYDA
jgi:hypothetical protein